VVWKLDRLGRSLRHLVDTVTGLADRGVGFRSLQEAIDTTTPGGKLVFHVFAALAEFEPDRIRERPTAGLAARPGPGPPRRPTLGHDHPQAEGRPGRCTTRGYTLGAGAEGGRQPPGHLGHAPTLGGRSGGRSPASGAGTGLAGATRRVAEDLVAERQRAAKRHR
jgi:hypothetical protein